MSYFGDLPEGECAGEIFLYTSLEDGGSNGEGAGDTLLDDAGDTFLKGETSVKDFGDCSKDPLLTAEGSGDDFPSEEILTPAF